MKNWVMRLTGVERTTLDAALSPDDCAQRIRRSVDGPFSLFGHRPVHGVLLGRTVWLKRRVELLSRRAFRTATWVRIETGAGGATLHCLSLPALSSLLVGAAWVAFSGFTALASLMAILIRSEDSAGGLRLAIPAILFVVLLVGGIVVRLAADHDEHYEIVSFLMRTTSAETRRRPARPGATFVR
jgi:hypothetical protein